MDEKRFYRSLNASLLLLAGIFAAGIASLAGYKEGHSGAAIGSLVAFIMGAIDFVWGRQVPYIRVTEREIILSRNIFLRKKRFDLGKIIRVRQIKKSTLELVLANDEVEKISLSPLSGEDRSALTQVLEYRSGLEVEKVQVSFWKSWSS